MTIAVISEHFLIHTHTVNKVFIDQTTTDKNEYVSWEGPCRGCRSWGRSGVTGNGGQGGHTHLPASAMEFMTAVTHRTEGQKTIYGKKLSHRAL